MTFPFSDISYKSVYRWLSERIKLVAYAVYADGVWDWRSDTVPTPEEVATTFLGA
jgi:hypothetical protein